MEYFVTCVVFAEEGLFAWAAKHRVGEYVDHVEVEAEIDSLIITRGVLSQFETTVREWARLYCRMACFCYFTMLIELNRELNDSACSCIESSCMM